jgi:dihydroneopterin aldolase
MTLELLDMQFYAHHGCFEEERNIGTRFCVDLWLDIGYTRRAVETDALEDALDYQDLYAIVKQEMAQPSALLEHVAGRILKALKAAFPQTGSIKVSIAKCHPPLSGPVGASKITLSTHL